MPQPTPDPVRTAHAHLMVACRTAKGGKAGDPAAVEEARRNFAAAKLETYIARIVAEAPPLTEGQRERLARVMAGAN